MHACSPLSASLFAGWLLTLNVVHQVTHKPLWCRVAPKPTESSSATSITSINPEEGSPSSTEDESEAQSKRQRCN